MDCAPPKNTRAANHPPGRARISRAIRHSGHAIIAVTLNRWDKLRDTNPLCRNKAQESSSIESPVGAPKFSWFIRAARFGQRRTMERGQFPRANSLMAKSRSKLRSANSRKKPVFPSKGYSHRSIPSRSRAAKPFTPGPLKVTLTQGPYAATFFGWNGPKARPKPNHFQKLTKLIGSISKPRRSKSSRDNWDCWNSWRKAYRNEIAEPGTPHRAFPMASTINRAKTRNLQEPTRMCGK